MKFAKIGILLAGFTAAAGMALAQSGTDTNGSYSSHSPGNSSQNPMSLGQSWTGGRLKATGRMSGNELRAGRVIGAEVSDSSNSRLGSIRDLVINPTSGKIDFAVISLSETGTSGLQPGSTYGSSSSTGGTANNESSQTGATSSKLIPVPWSLLQPTAGTRSTESGSSSAIGNQSQYSFTVNVDRTKLEQAPSLSNGNWSQITRSDWLQKVYSHYGLLGNSSTGGGESPSGSSSGSGYDRQSPSSGNHGNP